MKNILVIDDDFDFREIFSLILSEKDCAIWQASSTEEAFETLQAEDRFDMIFCDLHLPFTLSEKSENFLYSEEVGIRTISELYWVYQGIVPIIAMSASPKSDFEKLYAHVGDVPTLEKPVKSAELDSLLQLIPQKEFSEELSSEEPLFC